MSDLTVGGIDGEEPDDPTGRAAAGVALIGALFGAEAPKTNLGTAYADAAELGEPAVAAFVIELLHPHARSAVPTPRTHASILPLRAQAVRQLWRDRDALDRGGDFVSQRGLVQRRSPPT
jgi:hypothetical protein